MKVSPKAVLLERVKVAQLVELKVTMWADKMAVELEILMAD